MTLSGGVFLNAFLTARCAPQALAADGFEVLRHRKVPASDAGIALGQVAVLRPPRLRCTRTDRRRASPEEESPCA